MKNKLKGKYGEDLAVSYLEEKGFEIIERNYRWGRAEIDLIGLLNNRLLVFFEVKYRKNEAFGYPEIFVSENQEAKILEAADQYIYAINWQWDIRFDIISIQGEKLDHFEDAFY